MGEDIRHVHGRPFLRVFRPTPNGLIQKETGERQQNREEGVNTKQWLDRRMDIRLYYR